MKVIIVDDDKLVSLSIKTILTSHQIEVLSIGSNAEDAIKLYKHNTPDIILMDIRMGEKDGLYAAEEIIKYDKNAKILFLTTFEDDEYIIKAINIGAKGYILKQSYECIIPSLEAVYSGQIVFGEKIMSKIPKLLTHKNKSYNIDFGLIDKEIEIISLIAKGLSNKEIANILFLSEGTIRNYISNILDKLNLRDRTQIAIFYYNKNIII